MNAALAKRRLIGGPTSAAKRSEAFEKPDQANQANIVLAGVQKSLNPDEVIDSASYALLGTDQSRIIRTSVSKHMGLDPARDGGLH